VDGVAILGIYQAESWAAQVTLSARM
jgi:hypothetical protein